MHRFSRFFVFARMFAVIVLLLGMLGGAIGTLAYALWPETVKERLGIAEKTPEQSVEDTGERSGSGIVQEHREILQVAEMREMERNRQKIRQKIFEEFQKYLESSRANIEHYAEQVRHICLMLEVDVAPRIPEIAEKGVDSIMDAETLLKEIVPLVESDVEEKIRQEVAVLVPHYEQATKYFQKALANLREKDMKDFQTLQSHLAALLPEDMRSEIMVDMERLVRESLDKNNGNTTKSHIHDLRWGALIPWDINSLNLKNIVNARDAAKGIAKKIASKTGWRIGLGTAAAAADGPLPVGDIISAGLWVWSAWDLNEFKNTVMNLKSNCRESLETGLYATLQETEWKFLATQEKITDVVWQDHMEIRTELWKQIQSL